MTATTSTGHALSDASWLDVHYQSARAEYEQALRWVGIEPGWSVLDAGCGGGGFLPLMSELVGAGGHVTAMDLAPENVTHVEALVRDGRLPSRVEPKIGSLLSLPFGDETFDAVWSANVFQYLSEAESVTAIAELKRVLKPGGTLAIKDFDQSLVSFSPLDPAITHRFMAQRWAYFRSTGFLGPTPLCGQMNGARLRRAGFIDVRNRSWLVERWAPVSEATRAWAKSGIGFWATMSEEHDLPDTDRALWRETAANLDMLINDPDFCFREGFVVAVGRKTNP
jgi:arsenite methyltransferase